MQPRNRFAYVYLIIGAAALIGWPFIQNAIWPPPPKKATKLDLYAFVGGGLTEMGIRIDAPGLEDLEREKQYANRARLEPALAVASPLVSMTKLSLALPVAEKPIPKTPQELIALKPDARSHLSVLLNSRGASIQQVVLQHFQHADREGLPVKNADGSKKPLHLIPGVRVPTTRKIGDQSKEPVPELAPGKVDSTVEYLEHPSYVMYHYEKAIDDQPVTTLADREWKVLENKTENGLQTVSFETILGAPHYLKITKTYTLKADDYHVGLNVNLTPHNRPADAKADGFRYQIDGPKSIPLEGEWYATTYRQGVMCAVDNRGNTTRVLEDSRDIRHLEGGDRLAGKDTKPIRYVGIMVQYFSSVLALDDQQPEGQKADYLEYVRFTPQGPTHKDKTFLDDITFRAISKALDPTVAVTHPYILYQGPVKVRLLKQLSGDEAVPETTVDRYRDTLHLNTLTDAPMPNFMGRFANAIFWTDIVIAFTNLIHSLLGLLTSIIPNLGICIIIITLLVRGALFPFSRKQSLNAKVMQEKQAKIAPEMKKLTEKYGNDFNRLNAEKMRLYREHGINPAAAFGGCLMLFAQMPVFMGLYYALQESVFFRLESFLWMPNLAAPDMLIPWSERIPFISAPEDLGTTFYLGPYFNILPIIAVALMMYTQSKMMPVSEDPQVQMQQKTMKFMMILFAFFFYKVAAGLCIYFIMSSVWGMIERRILKNAKLPDTSAKAISDGKDKKVEPKGWLGKKMAAMRERMGELIEEAQKQQQAQVQNPKPNGKDKKKRK